jgi:MoaA/NifB/PqqE/SkfB family radical SAM enzyme
MRGEPTIRKDLPDLIKEARRLGYTNIQLQTNGRMLSDGKFLTNLITLGVTDVEISIYGDTPALHDGIARSQHAFIQTIKGIRNTVRSGIGLIVTAPVILNNYKRLSGIAAVLNEVGVHALQFNFSRPVNIRGKWRNETIARLSECSPYIRKAIRKAREYGMAVSTEAIPFCHLEYADLMMKDISEDWQRFRVADLHIIHDSMANHRALSRPSPPECADCLHKKCCSTTWREYQELFGAGEFMPVYE